MERILNYRKLADGKFNQDGKQIKNIYRSADISRASEIDKKIMKENQIRHVIDLRSEDEYSTGSIFNDKDIMRIQIDILEDTKQNDIGSLDQEIMLNYMLKIYEEQFVNSSGFKKEFNYIKEVNGDGFLFHCTAGKDRTGVTGIILMHMLGFSKEQIFEEYLMIDEKLVEHIFTIVKEKIAGLDLINEEFLRKVATVDRDYIIAFYTGIEKKYGSLDNYITQELMWNQEDINNLKQNYLTN